MTSDRRDQDPSDFILDLANIGAELIDNNRDLIDGLLSEGKGGTRFDLDGGGTSSQAGADKDRVWLVVHNPDMDISDVKITENEDNVTVRVGEQTYVLKDLPGDAEVDNGDLSVNNGVLTVEFPRGENDSDAEFTGI